ncbi:MAG TPA: hypothetical protein VHD87_00105 [Acidimicrobiales bacterium]|nr:hypothetical protein [Acidimicrobiales bacterium]
MNPPRLAVGLEVVPLVDGVAVVNGGPPALFQGRAATELLIPLLHALDGTLNAHGLAEHLGLPEAHITRGLQLLADRGLLEPD